MTGKGTIFGLLLGLTAGTSANAALVAYEGFDYSADSAVSGLNAGTGWNGAWSASSTNGTQMVRSPDMGGQGNRMVLTATGANITSDASRTLYPSNQSTGTFWFSLVMRPDGGNSTSIGYAQLNDSNSNVPVRVGYTINGLWYIRSPYNANTTANTVITAVNGTAVQLLAKVDLDANIADLWLNPDASNLGSPNASVSMGTSTNIRFDRLSVRTSSPNATGSTMTSFDEYRIGTSAADVVPEPASIALLAVFGSMLGLRRKVK